MTYPPPYEQQPGAQPTQPVSPHPPSSSPPTAPYPSYLGAPTPPRRSNGPILAVVVALAVLLVGGTVTAGVLLVNRGDDPGRVTADPTRDAETPRVERTTPETEPTGDDDGGYGNEGGGGKVVYEVTGDGPVSIVYLKEDGVTPERASDTDLPWRKEVTMTEDAALVTVTAIRSGGGKGTIQCRITIDGEEVAKKEASGTFATATCTKLIL
ncbi:MmpS family transport accessory protein [Phytohabitans sp. ZYX-F-186]|uniref:MmpS family transport accessory protein n=1 Tax=Phytohabitans maris TaxID=3071409 RepID=A0ABU0Z8D4_9ACTN|nr:MmpS family transport accessory protein [Phytohabitans sp. ZYX-F-186]MDQ7903326.1 MmpS family transport accessory protein [Phytohabitans sp. ZYX-F-186]